MPSDGQKISAATPEAHPLEPGQSFIFTKHVCHLELGPYQEVKAPLGSFGGDHAPKGFCAEFTPEVTRSDTITVRIVSIGRASRYELMLYATNHTDSTVQIEVWQM